MARRKKKKDEKKGVQLEDIQFYFDSVARDRLDNVGFDRKTGEVLALREKLVKLPTTEFDAAIKTMNKLVETGEDPRDRENANQTRRIQAQELFDRSQESGGGQTTPEVSAV